jgi:hypothetical protein
VEIIKLVWDILKILWDVGKNIGPFAAKRCRLRRDSWHIMVRKGAKAAGTPAKEVEDLLEAFENPAFYTGATTHPILQDTRKAIWRIHQRLDELRLLAVAELSEPEGERCWAIDQIGQRSGAYALPSLSSIAHSLGSPERVKAAADLAILEIHSRTQREGRLPPGLEVGPAPR